jgi:hypothetical protein
LRIAWITRDVDGKTIARLPDGWVIDWRDVARLMLEDLEREDPPLVKRLAQPHGDMQRGRGLRTAPGLRCLS